MTLLKYLFVAIACTAYNSWHAKSSLETSSSSIENEQLFLLALDGFGDGFSGAHGHLVDGNPIVKDYFSSKDSLGLLYTAATQHLGLGGFGSEGKLQGLAPYGNYCEKFSIDKFFSKNNCSFSIDEELVSKDDFACQELYAVQAIATNKYFSKVIEKRFNDEPLCQHHMDFAATIQQDIFNIVLHLCHSLKTDDTSSLVISGGLAQNSTLINKIVSQGLFDEVYTTSSCADRGNSLGALYCFLKNVNLPFPEITPFLGADISESCPDFKSMSEKHLLL